MKKININKLSVLFYCLLFIFCIFSMHLYGRTSQHTVTFGLWMLASFYVTIKISRKLFIGYFIFSVLIALLYGVTGLLYGKMSYGIVTALFNTDSGEVTEFILTIPVKIYLILFLYLIFSIITYKIYKKTAINQEKGKTFYILASLVVIIFMINPIKSFTNAYNTNSHLLKALKGIHYYPFRVPADFAYYTKDYFNKLEEFERIKQSPDTFNVTKTEPQHQINVMIIGESMRRDYMSLYGYPHPTTPFLDKTPSLIWDNYISASGATALALERSLFAHKKDKIEEQIYTDSVTALAKKAGYHQYWISNQGVFSVYSTAATMASLKADYRWFNSSKNKDFVSHSDVGLLKQLDYAIKDKVNQPKLITLHISGSHSKFCSRISSEYKIKRFKQSGDKELGCYLNSLRQTDNLIELVYHQLKASGKSFSIMYFSDHGLSTFMTKLSGFHLTHSGKYKQNFDVPMIILSSDDTKQRHIKAKKSGYDFMALFAQWLGITETSLKEKGEKMFDETENKPIYVFDFSKVVTYDSLKVDEAAILPQSSNLILE